MTVPLIDTHVARIEVQSEQLVIRLAPAQTPGRSINDDRQRSKREKVLNVAWRKTPSTRRREILLPTGIHAKEARPIRSETRALLIASIARGRRWLAELLAEANTNAVSIAKRERCSARQVNMTISLAFLAPNLVRAAIEGRLPRGVGVESLRDAPIEWSRQHAMLGLPW